MFDFEKILSQIGRARVLCIGDLMLDDFVYGDVSRISPEAPAPVIAVKRESVVIGGAGNVARNVAALGARCVFLGVIGNDMAGRMLKSEFAYQRRKIKARLKVDKSRPTTRKLRFVSEQHSTHLLRADWEAAKPIDAKIEAALIRDARAAIKGVDAVILSDYAKGLLTRRVIRAVIRMAKRHGKPVVVDPKGKDFSIYRGATIITPNRKELVDATRKEATSRPDLVGAASELARAIASKAVLVTMSEEGMLLFVRPNTSIHVPAYSVKVRDVSGAGDTVVAVLALMLGVGAKFEAAMRMANAAASVVVGKSGTATVTVPELRARILPAAALAPEEKIIFDWRQLDEPLKQWRQQDLRIGFTNGVFDLLHPGHIRVLARARGACDRLVVGLNADVSVRRLKGEGRPVQSEQARAEVLAALEAVDLVVVFDQDTPLELIRRVRPNVLVKGADYRGKKVVGREQVEAAGGEVMLVDLLPGHSTTGIVRRTRAPR